jgi:hypothetical protein
MDAELFKEKCPCGYYVSLTSEQYNVHIVLESGHGVLTISDIESCIKCPQAVYHSTYGYADRMVYFSTGCETYPKLIVKTITEIDDKDNKIAHVVTAFPTAEIKGGIDTGRGPIYVNVTNKL